MAGLLLSSLHWILFKNLPLSRNGENSSRISLPGSETLWWWTGLGASHCDFLLKGWTLKSSFIIIFSLALMVDSTLRVTRRGHSHHVSRVTRHTKMWAGNLWQVSRLSRLCHDSVTMVGASWRLSEYPSHWEAVPELGLARPECECHSLSLAAAPGGQCGATALWATRLTLALQTETQQRDTSWWPGQAVTPLNWVWYMIS